jgi:hypothetical protein
MTWEEALDWAREAVSANRSLALLVFAHDGYGVAGVHGHHPLAGPRDTVLHDDTIAFNTTAFEVSLPRTSVEEIQIVDDGLVYFVLRDGGSIGLHWE